jgi:7-carboxy-7-deazaguanine synthase
LSGDRTWRGTLRPGSGELLVSEVFGPTLQGEGPSAGRAAAFVRLGGCPLACSWCDSAFTWDASRHDLVSELTVRSRADVAREALATGAPLAVITGGEPALQAVEAAALAGELVAAGMAVELETSGTVPLGPLGDACRLLVVSPKLSNSGLPERARLRWPVLKGIAALDHSVFKFVVEGPGELDEVRLVADRLELAPQRVWVMPEGTDPAVVTGRMAELAVHVARRGWSLSGRLHVLLWGDERGR